MKKFLALFLVLVMAFSCVLVSCNKDKGNDNGDDTGDDDGIIGGIGTQPTGSTSSGQGGTTAPDKTTHTDFSWTDDTAGTMVYVMVDGVSVRSDTNASKDESNNTWRATANFGESYKRLKYNDQWTLIDYKGNEYYISSKYITVDDGYITFEKDAEETTVYVVAASLALRTNTYVEYDDNIRTYALKDAELTRVATSKNGKWIKVRCTYTPTGKTDPVTEVLCCKAEFVSATKDSAPTVTPPQLG